VNRVWFISEMFSNILIFDFQGSTVLVHIPLDSHKGKINSYFIRKSLFVDLTQTHGILSMFKESIIYSLIKFANFDF